MGAQADAARRLQLAVVGREICFLAQAGVTGRRNAQNDPKWFV